MSLVQLQIPGLITIETWNIIAQYVLKIGFPNDLKPRLISFHYSNKLDINQVDDLKRALSVYKSWGVLTGPHYDIWKGRYFTMQFSTFKNRDTVISDIQRMINAGKILNFETGQTESNRSIPLSIPKVEPVEKTVKNKRNLESFFQDIKPYQNYIIIALAVLVFVMFIKKI